MQNVRTVINIVLKLNLDGHELIRYTLLMLIPKQWTIHYITWTSWRIFEVLVGLGSRAVDCFCHFNNPASFQQFCLYICLLFDSISKSNNVSSRKTLLKFSIYTECWSCLPLGRKSQLNQNIALIWNQSSADFM